MMAGAAFAPMSLCSIEDGAGEGAGGGGGGGDGGAGGGGAGAGGGASGIGGAADLLAGAGAGGEGGGAGAAAGGEGAGGGAAAGAGAGGDGAWLELISAEGGDADNPAHRDWIRAKGFKSLDDVVKSYREAEHAIRNGGKLTVPGEGAKPEEIAVFHKAIGVPETVDGYEVKVPEGADLDAGFVDPMKERALKAGIPAKAFNELANGFVDWQQQQLEAMKVAEDGDAAAWANSAGADKPAKMADVAKAMKALDLSAADVAGIQRGLALVHGKPGSARTLDLLAKLGAGMGEDALVGGGRQTFGITATEAQAKIDAAIKDPKWDPAGNPEHKARWDYWNRVVSADVDRKQREEASA